MLGFSSASLFPAKKREAVIQGGTRRITIMLLLPVGGILVPAGVTVREEQIYPKTTFKSDFFTTPNLT